MPDITVVAILGVALFVVAPVVGGIPLVQTALFGAYWLLYIFAPGMGLARIARVASDDAAGELVIAVGLGYSVHLLLWITLALFGQSDAYTVVGAAVGALGLLMAANRRSRRAPRHTSDRSIGPAALAVAFLTTVLVISDAFVFTPLVPPPEGMQLYQDLVFNHSLAAEAVRSIPPGMPWLAGDPFGYHWFVNAHIGATAQALDSDVAAVLYRLYLPPLLLATFVGTAWLAARTAIRHTRMAATIAALILLGTEIGASFGRENLLSGSFREDLWRSPSLLLALPLIIAAIGLLVVSITKTANAKPTWRWWLCWLILCFGMSGAKGSALPVIGLGTLVAGIYATVRRMPWGRVASLAGATALASFALAMLTVYARGDVGIVLRPFATLWRMSLQVPGLRLVGLLVPFVGLVVLLADMIRSRLGAPQLIMLAVIATGLGAFLAFDQPGFSQLYFLLVVYPLAASLAAVGTAEIMEKVSRPHPLVITGVGVAASIVAVGSSLPLSWRTALLVLVAFGATAAVVLAIFSAEMRLARPAVVAVTTVICLGVVDAVGDVAAPMTTVLAGRHAHAIDTNVSRGLSPAMLEALTWIRVETPPGTLLVVDNHWLGDEATSRYFYYSAYSNRRVFLESWEYSPYYFAEGSPDGVPRQLETRLNINRSVLLNGDRKAACELRRSGVGYVLRDLRYGYGTKAVSDVADLVFKNSDAAIYRMREDPCRT